MKRRRVKITGIGPVTPAGIGKEAFQEGILEGVSRVTKVTRFPSEAGAFVAAEVRRFNIRDYVGTLQGNRLPRHTQFALAATNLALSDAGLIQQDLEKFGPVIVTGTSLMDSSVVSKSIENVALKGHRFGLARVIFEGPVSSIPATIAETIGCGRIVTLQTACCAGVDAIGHAAEFVANGESDLAICGGTEAPIYYHPMLELKLAGLSPATAERPEELSRPFDMWRTTGVIGEGACMLVLEPDSSPRSGYAFVAGYSFANDQHARPASGLSMAVRYCLAQAHLNPKEVETISAWGPGHKEIDKGEATALKEVFQDDIERIPAVSIKGAIGNPFAAAGAIQVGCGALGLQEAFIPPTVNWRYPDPACKLNLSCRTRLMSYHNVLVSAHGLSGANACILLERYCRR